MSTEILDVAVLGAGLSGIASGVKLREAGFSNFLIFEKAGDVGGTWRDNRYPGIACDVPSHLYSLSFELNPDWTHNYSGGGEIWDYVKRVTGKHDLWGQIRLNSEVTDAKFDGTLWNIFLKDGSIYQARNIVSALGGLHKPKHVQIEGKETFAGKIMHTAEWDTDWQPQGRKVAIIGTGASGAQVLPNIAPDVQEVTMFQRSAAWVFPRIATDISEKTRSRFRRFPFLMRLYRWFLFTLMDVMGMGALKRNGPMRGRMRQMALNHLEEAVNDPETRAKLTPDYDPGCKRRCVSDDYLQSFNRDNVHLVTDGIVRIEPNGIVDTSGTLHEVDTIIDATGFHPFNITDYVNIEGRDGKRLRDVWEADGVVSHRTVMMPGFPNMFFLLGPNSGTGHTSALIMAESCIGYMIKALKFMKRRNLAVLDPDPEFVSQYNDRLQNDMKKMVFSGGCNAWYTDKHDRNYTLWPYSAARYILEQARFKPQEFKTSKAG